MSGHGYLSKYEELVNRINNASANHMVRAELAFLIRNFDPAKLFQFEQSIEHGISLITDWLPKYKFSHWNKTKSRGKTVTDRMKRTRAKTIAKILGDASKWHSHGRGITMSRLSENDLKLEIDDFSNDEELMSMIKN